MSGVLRLDLEETEKRTTDRALFAWNFRKYIAAGTVVTSIDSMTVVNLGQVSGSVDVTVEDETFAGTKILAYVAGGTDLESYDVIARAILSDGQDLAIAARVNVIDRT